MTDSEPPEEDPIFSAGDRIAWDVAHNTFNVDDWGAMIDDQYTWIMYDHENHGYEYVIAPVSYEIKEVHKIV